MPPGIQAVPNTNINILHIQVNRPHNSALQLWALLFFDIPSYCWHIAAQWYFWPGLRIPVYNGDRRNVGFVRHFWTWSSHSSHPSLKCINLCHRRKMLWEKARNALWQGSLKLFAHILLLHGNAWVTYYKIYGWLILFKIESKMKANVWYATGKLCI